MRVLVLLAMTLIPRADPAFAAPAVTERPGNAGVLFRHHCQTCHGAGGPGTVTLRMRLPKDQSPLLDRRTDIPADFVRAVVRAGIGFMPRFSRIELPDDQLSAIAGYLARNSSK